MPHPLTPAPPVADCWAWINPNDVVRHALAAFYSTCRYNEAVHRLWGPETLQNREQFAKDLGEVFELRIAAAAHKAGISGFDYAEEMLAGYLTACPPEENVLTPRETPHDIHCGASFGPSPTVIT
jgi:hypothetical protein